MHTPRNIQSPNTATDFWNQHNSANPRMVTCIKVTPKSFWSGVSPLGFTSNTRDMTLPGHVGITFKASPAITPTIIETALDEPSNLEVTAIYNADSFTQTDVLAGKWEFAEIEVFVVSWQNVNLGELLHFRGKLGEFKDYQTYFTAEARGLLSMLSNDVDKVTSRFCRVKEFRDAECGHTALTVDIDGDTYNVLQESQVVADANDQFISCTSSKWDGTFPPHDILFRNGKITMTSGANSGVSREIAATEAIFPGLQIELKRLFPFTPEVDDTFDLVAGCDRTLERCVMYENVVNRRAEDWIPGIESANRIPPSN